MYVSIRRYQVTPGDVDAISEDVATKLVPVLKETPGFVAYYAIDQGDGTIASVSVFEDEAGARESERRAAERVKTLGKLFPNPPQITTGTVRVSASA